MGRARGGFPMSTVVAGARAGGGGRRPRQQPCKRGDRRLEKKRGSCWGSSTHSLRTCHQDEAEPRWHRVAKQSSCLSVDVLILSYMAWLRPQSSSMMRTGGISLGSSAPRADLGLDLHRHWPVALL